ncbi:piggyBac transposable element-derived protein 2-like [Strongylocentrotus purpuratus]|uniref:PiggyBac transposable element-derived protein domain-containing protein n=1 Tax=Strongylocentrotus purpuratus TaxID=7668 RepID=A0A7M7N5F9_STRPU|nr:piggyBac transposable element-derived protein 2-like [Strongylocentrotus purpuratus]
MPSTRGYWETETRYLPVADVMSRNRLKDCRLMDDKELKKCGRGATDHWVEDSVGVVAIKWYDNKPVTLLSTFVGVDPTDSVRRWDKAKKEHVQVSRPSIVKEYNKFMGGVDLHDSLTALYKYPVRSKRWYIYIWYHTLTMVVVNAWLLYRRHCGQLGCSHLPLRKFQASAASCLTSAGKRARGRPSNTATLPSPAPVKWKKSPANDIGKDGVDHLPLWVVKRQRCKHCQGGFLSFVQCTKCDVHLCLNKDRNCFAPYHTPNNFPKLII